LDAPTSIRGVQVDIVPATGIPTFRNLGSAEQVAEKLAWLLWNSGWRTEKGMEVWDPARNDRLRGKVFRSGGELPIISLSKSSRVTIICDRELLCDISWDRVRSNVHEPHKKAWVDMGSNRHFSMRSGSRTG